jgi:protocatechuate 3,4-dioxygenase beta subunit
MDTRIAPWRAAALAALILIPALAAAEAPPDPGSLTPEMRLAPEGEPGEPLVITGTIFQTDGETPAGGVVLYAYQTNRDGTYPGRGEAQGIEGRHGRLRSWLRTGPDGRYRITTIRPGSYPGSRIAQHIHVHLTLPGGEERIIRDFNFADDPFISDAQREGSARRGPVGNVLVVKRDADGIWRGERDIVIGG